MDIAFCGPKECCSSPGKLFPDRNRNEYGLVQMESIPNDSETPDIHYVDQRLAHAIVLEVDLVDWRMDVE